jgi:hypothetical protein
MPLPTEAEALMTLLGSARAEITRLRAMVEAADGLADVVAGLTKQARVACKLGATIGPHWTHLGLAQMMTDAALATYQQKREGGE